MVDKMYRRLFFIQLLVSSVATIGNCIDGILLGRFLGATALAASGLVYPIIIISSTLSDVFAAGVQILCTRAIAENDHVRANKQVGLSIIVGTTIGALFAIFAFFFTDEICLALGAEPESELFYATQAYARGLLPTLLGLTPVSILMYVCQTNGNMKNCKIAGILIVGLNIAFDLVALLVFHCDLFGLGLATSLATLLTLLYLSIVVRRNKGDLCPSYRNLPWEDMRGILLYGSTRATYKLCIFLQSFFINSFLLHTVGETGVAAYSVARATYGISSSIVSGLYSTTTLTTSIAFGEENREALRDIIKTFVKYGLILGCGAALFSIIIAEPIVWLYLDPSDPAFDMAVMAQRLISLQLPVSSIAVCFQNFFVSTKRIGFGVVLTILIQIVFVPLFMVAFWYAFGITGVWAAFPSSYLGVLLCLGAYCGLRNKANPLKAETYLMLPKGFGPAKDQQVRMNITDRSQVDIAKKAIEKIGETPEKKSSAGNTEATTADPAQIALVESYMKEMSFIILDLSERCGGGINILRVYRKNDEWALSFWIAMPAIKSKKEQLAVREYRLQCNKKLEKVMSTLDDADSRSIFGFGRIFCKFPTNPSEQKEGASSGQKAGQ